jgi:hypothetical protein
MTKENASNSMTKLAVTMNHDNSSYSFATDFENLQISPIKVTPMAVIDAGEWKISVILHHVMKLLFLYFQTFSLSHRAWRDTV